MRALSLTESELRMAAISEEQDQSHEDFMDAENPGTGDTSHDDASEPQPRTRRMLELNREPLNPAEVLNHACSVVSRNLTPEEWRRYLPEVPYRRYSPCSNLPSASRMISQVRSLLRCLKITAPRAVNDKGR